MQQEARRKSRRALSMVLAGLVLCLGSGLMSAGCASNERRVLVPVPEATPEDPVPESTLANLKECAERWGGDLIAPSYEVEFDLTVTGAGWVTEVAPKRPRLDVRDMEECMMGALQNMTVPSFVLEKAASEMGSRQVPAQARGFIGQAEAMDEVLFTLAPVIIEAGPVAILVTIGIVAAASVADWSKRRGCPKEWEYAEEQCEKMLKSNDPPLGVTGNKQTVMECAKGLVSRRCGGNKVNYRDDGPRPGRKT
jgi:hypothetical protein